MALFTAVAVLTLFSIENIEAKKISMKTLLEEMVDRDNLATMEGKDFTVGQCSSYDRRSVSKDKPHWFANWDRSWFVRTENNDGRIEHVMMDEKGPGVIVRFWMTFAGENCGLGTLRIYIDDNPTPVIEGTAFEILSGGSLAGYPLSSSVSELTPYEQRGHNLYLPIPYSKRCKVTYESEHVREDDPGARSSENVYYNINFRTYTGNVEVESFSDASLKKYKNTISKVQTILKEGMPQCRKTDVILDCELDAGEEKVFLMTGPAAIRDIRMKISADNQVQALRSLVVCMEFDGEQTVWIPVGDFFGIGYKYGLVAETWFTRCSSDGLMSAAWVMPFAEQCKITLLNCGNEAIRVSDASICIGKWKWDNNSLHFGASWHQYTRIGTGAGQDMEGLTPGPSDLNYISLKGQGLYVGDVLSVRNDVMEWWGEGDEKIYIDEDAFPSHFGTGTEDYYGYAWCRPENFTGHPFIGLPDGSGNLGIGFSVNCRFRTLDAIPFKKSLVLDMELWHWADTEIDYAPAAFWYLKPDGKTNAREDMDGVKFKCDF